MTVQPLDDQEFDRLDTFLMCPRTPEATMDLEMLDGFLVALNIGPEEVPEDEWLPAVFDGQVPEFSDKIEADDIMDLIRRHATTVREAFSAKSRARPGEQALYYPLILNDEGMDEKWQETIGQYWASGFHAGVAVREEAWQGAMDESDDFYNTIARILTLELGHDPDDEEEKKITIKQREDRLDELPWLIEELMYYWLEQRFGKVETVKNEEPKVGRNDPCPCGSGKKYKKCHGA
ncbi:UPF0149 family protein [Silvimonas amylolytica]|uniref:YecA family protein n=1 Tax=Silvimonas amylolytica TaxID=449663 RepID=A0ABQ2PGF8_9NEIS|nr:UPF0149 family protein [Silvimonas amylolytica]GGP24285.1 hypothetical protein GCM10010971_01040 [Silvimonas amylolytica]